MVHLSATEARVHFGELLRRVAKNHETVFIERKGSAQAVVVPVPDYHRLLCRADSEVWRGRALLARDLVQMDVSVRPAGGVDDLTEYIFPAPR